MTTIDEQELAICRRRGHKAETGLSQGWAQCAWCGLWLRKVETIEERTDTPPEAEQNQQPVLRRKLRELGDKQTPWERTKQQTNDKGETNK